MSFVKILSEKTGLAEKHILYGVLGICLSFILFGIGSGILCTLIGIVYPTYMSIKALQTSDGADDSQWLTYWCVFAYIHVIEQCFEFILAFIPFYHVLKVAFLIYLWHPNTLGADSMYHQFLKPYLSEYGVFIDTAIDSAGNAANTAKGYIK